MEGIDKDIAAPVHLDIFGGSNTRTRIEISSRIIESPLGWIRRDKVGDFFGHKPVANIVNPQSGMEIAIINAVVPVFQGRVVMRLERL